MAKSPEPEGAGRIDAYLAALPADQRAALEALRGQILKTAPVAVETIAYGLPAFKLEGRSLVYFGAAKAHCAFYPGSASLMEAFAADLAAYDVSKGTIRFQPRSPLPPKLVARIVKYRIAENQALEARRKKR